MQYPLSFFFSSRRRHTSCGRDWSSDVCSSDLGGRPPHFFHVEVQSEGDPGMNLRMLEYWVWMKRNFRKKEKEPFGVSCFVIYLSRRGYRPDSGGVDEGDGFGTKTRFR